MHISKFSFGAGDRFAHQGEAQLAALKKAKEFGTEITPVWNKSHREHTTIGSQPASTRREADAAVNALNWSLPYLVDADHVNLANVDGFLPYADFYTIDVADYIGRETDTAALDAFVAAHKKYCGTLHFEGIEETFRISEMDIRTIGAKFLFACQEAGRIYRYIVEKKSSSDFVPEVSMDETDTPQSPVELFFILAALAQEGVPAQTIAPKFTGRFNKGVDYVGDLDQFTKEFEQDIAVITKAVNEFGLPENLKLSVHSGSDKFSIYLPIHRAIKKFNCGLHVKTAGTTWLEELIGLAESGGNGLEIAKEVYQKAFEKADALCAPYATVIDIDASKLPAPATVAQWDGDTYARSLRHKQDDPLFNPHFRQLLHVGYKIAAQMGDRYLDALKANKDIIAKNVTENIFERHIKPIFLGD